MKSTKMASLEKFKGLTVLGQHDPYDNNWLILSSNFSLQGGIWYPVGHTPHQSKLPDCVPHLHDLWSQEFLTPTIKALFQAMLVHTKFNREVQRWMAPFV